VYNEIARVSTSYMNGEKCLAELYMFILKVDGLMENLSTREGETALVKRLMHNDMTRSLLSTVVVDGQEEMTRETLNISGIVELIGKMEEAVTSVTGIPKSLLIGGMPSGLSTGDTTGLEYFYDKVKAKQIDQLQKPLQQLARIVGSLPEMKSVSSAENYQITFNPIERKSAKTIAETRKVNADTDKLYYDMGVLHAEEIRSSRFGGSEYSSEIVIDQTIEAEEKEIQRIDSLAGEL
jgi:phage-related protein (TIGR01555 family)